jgi:hypothetical protein
MCILKLNLNCEQRVTNMLRVGCVGCCGHSVRAIDALQQSHEKEVTSLRQQLLDFQAQSDEKTVIGELMF